MGKLLNKRILKYGNIQTNQPTKFDDRVLAYPVSLHNADNAFLTEPQNNCLTFIIQIMV